MDCIWIRNRQRGHTPLTAYQWVDSDHQIAEIVGKIHSVDAYAIDTEFHRERTYYPQLALIQIAVAGDIYLIDVPKMSPSAVATLFNTDSLALLHAAQQDLEVLALSCGSKPRRIFDTQLAAGFVGYSTPSLSSLVQRELGIALPKGDRLTDWLRRPLTDDQCSYAASDVLHLHELHSRLTAQLQKEGRESWALDACDEMSKRPTAATLPEMAWLKMKDVRTLKPKSRGVAQAVAEWREERAQRLDVPVRQVLADLALLGISQRAPRTVDELSQSRGVDGRHTKGSIASEILEAVERGRTLTADFPASDSDEFDRDLRPAAALISAWVSEVASRTRIETALLATRADVIDYLRSPSSGRLREGWRAEILGADLDALRAGTAGISFDGAGGLRLIHSASQPTDGAEL